MKKVLLICVGVIAVIFIGGIAFLTNGLTQGAKVQINGIDLSGVSDGSYTGSYESGRWTNTVVVHVKNHTITAIDIEKDVFAAIENCSSEMFRRVIENQDTAVDAVSGATVTSKAYLKAIKNAFNNVR